MKKFKFRAECLTDVFLFFNHCPAGSIKNIEHNHLDGLESCTDIEITFESELFLGELKQICSEIEDGHVILETINFVDDYNEERN
jgi:hypothetical protein